MHYLNIGIFIKQFKLIIRFFDSKEISMNAVSKSKCFIQKNIKCFGYNDNQECLFEY